MAEVMTTLSLAEFLVQVRDDPPTPEAHTYAAQMLALMALHHDTTPVELLAENKALRHKLYDKRSTRRDVVVS